MLDAKLLPFPAAGGVTAPLRPPSTHAAGGIGFASMMDDAVGASSPARRGDAARPAPAPRPRPRPEAVKPRPTEAHAAPAARRTANVTRKPTTDRADDAARSEKSARPGDRSSEAPAVEAATSQTEEIQAKAEAVAGDAGAEPCAEAENAASATLQDEAEASAAGAAAAVAPRAESSAVAEGEAGTAGSPTATLPGVPAAGEEAGETKQADAGVRGRTPAPATSLPGRAGGKHTASARAEAPKAAGEVLVETAREGEEGVHEDAAAPPAPLRIVHAEPETVASSSVPAGKADAATALADAVSDLEAIAGTNASEGADVADAGTQDKPQPRQAQSTSGQAAPAVVAATGASDGIRFTVNVAAGSAAYASAAPRQEEVVLPQIVQSIRLQTAQGASEARVQLRPEHLGELNITLKVDQGQVTATIQASVAAVRQWIESNESSLRQALSEQGLELTRLVVQPDEEQANQEGPEQGDTRRQPPRRSWRGEDVTFEVLV